MFSAACSLRLACKVRHVIDAIATARQRYTNLHCAYNANIQRKHTSAEKHACIEVPVCCRGALATIPVKTTCCRVRQVVIDPEDRVLTISGDRWVEKEVQDRGPFWRIERKFGHFARAFRLPDNVDPDAITANVSVDLAGQSTEPDTALRESPVRTRS